MNDMTVPAKPTIDGTTISKAPFLNTGRVEQKRREILEYFHTSFSQYESLFECLTNNDAYYLRANPLRHPLIFYYGHTAVFFINKLNTAELRKDRVDQKLEDMLAIGVDEMSWDDLDPTHYSWPNVAAVKAYRDKVRGIVDEFIRSCDFTLPITDKDPLWIIMMGIEHERIHLETSTVLIRELPLASVHPHSGWARCQQSGVAPENSLLDVAGSKITLGKSRENPLYGWDNEYGIKVERVKSFKASKYLVSNREFLSFVEDGGYQEECYWSNEGWAWCQGTKIMYPHFWVKHQEGYRYRSMLEEFAMPWDWPVDINCLEAEAFCQWKSNQLNKNIALPTETQWTALRQMVEVDQPTWEVAPGNINLEHGASSCPVNRFEFANGFYDIIGNVWQWTQTAFAGFEGFATHPVYDDFSTPTFDGRHNVFKGGCWVSTGNYATKDARYAFRKHFFQNAGLRYVENV